MYSFNTQVTASHTGIDGLQAPVSVITMLQDCSQIGIDSEPEMQKYLKDNNLTIMIASRQVDFMQRAPYATPLTVKTGVYDCNGYFGYRNTALYGDDGTLYACSWSIGIFVSLVTGKPSRLSKELIETISYDEKLPMEHLSKRIDLPDCEPRIYPKLTAQRSDIDINKHVNNVQYIRMANEYLPQDTTFSRLRVEYKLPAKQGDTLIPHVYDAGLDAVYVALLNEQDKPYATIEFSRLENTNK